MSNNKLRLPSWITAALLVTIAVSAFMRFVYWPSHRVSPDIKAVPITGGTALQSWPVERDTDISVSTSSTPSSVQLVEDHNSGDNITFSNNHTLSANRLVTTDPVSKTSFGAWSNTYYLTATTPPFGLGTTTYINPRLKPSEFIVRNLSNIGLGEVVEIPEKCDEGLNFKVHDVTFLCTKTEWEAWHESGEKIAEYRLGAK